MNEHETLAQIEKLQFQIASHKKIIKRFSGNKSLVGSVQQYLKDPNPVSPRCDPT